MCKCKINVTEYKHISYSRPGDSQILPVGYNCFLCSSAPLPPKLRTSAAPLSNARPSTSNADAEAETIVDPDDLGDDNNDDGNNDNFPIEIRDKVLARFNVQRLVFIESKAKAEEHYREHHTCFTPTQLASLNGHFHLYFCRLCEPNDVEIAAVCCTPHLSDHIRCV